MKNLGARVAQWWEHSPPTNVARVQIPASTPYVGWVCCWFSPLLREVFLRVLRFSPLLKNQHFQIPIRPGYQVNQEPLCGCATCNSLFIYLTTLKYKNLFSLTSKILGSFMRVFTVLQKPIELSTGQGFIQWRALSSFLQIWAWRLKVTKKV